MMVLAAGAARVTAADAEDQGIAVSLVGLGDLPETLLYKDGTRVVSVDIPKSGRSEPIRYHGATPLVLFTEKVDAQGNKLRVPMTSISYQTGWTKVLAVLISSGKVDSPFRSLAFDDGRSGFPPDHARLFNFYSSDLAVNNAGQVERVASGQSALVTLKSQAGRAWMKLATLKGENWSALPPYVTQVSPGMRLLVFAYEQRTESGTMEPVYRTITEIAPPAESQAVAMR